MTSPRKARGVKSALKARPYKSATKNKVSIQAKKGNPKQIAKKVLAVAPEVVAKQPKPTTVKKDISQKLLESIEKRKANSFGAPAFGQPVRRRGRRPKNVEYTPSNQEDENFSYDSDAENLSYDTGIQVKGGGEDGGFSPDRLEDFDEELNFDW